MGLPAIRIGMQVPFPAKVSATGFLKITKANGIWTIRPDYTVLGSQVPTPSELATDLVAVYNSLTGQFVTMSLAVLRNALTGTISETAVNFAMSPYAVIATDTFLAVTTSGGAITINLPLAATRSGQILSIKDVSGNASTNNISIVRAGAETIDGLTTYPITSDYGGIRLAPRTNSWTVLP